jgi:predicted nucleic acid-binding protein
MNETTLVDTNVLLDVLTDDPKWAEWSSRALQTAADRGAICINQIVYAEVSTGFNRIEELEDALPAGFFRRESIPWRAGFLAGKAHLQYRRAGGKRLTPLPDFYIGAHAAVCGHQLLTRDTGRYSTYFPTVNLIAP